MKLARAGRLDQRQGKFMSIEDSRQGALVQGGCEGAVGPGNFQDDGAKRVGVCFASNTDLELWTEEGAGRHRQHDRLPEALSGGRPHRA